MSTISIPAEFHFVGAAIASTVVLHVWQGTRVSKARKLAKIAYPQMYAENSEVAASAAAQKFNCTQRAHQNTLEYLPGMLASSTYLGLLHPRLAAGSLVVWVIGRVFYTIGYSTGDPKQRTGGFYLSAVPALVVLFTSAAVSFQYIRGLL